MRIQCRGTQAEAKALREALEEARLGNEELHEQVESEKRVSRGQEQEVGVLQDATKRLANEVEFAKTELAK